MPRPTPAAVAMLRNVVASKPDSPNCRRATAKIRLRFEALFRSRREVKKPNTFNLEHVRFERTLLFESVETRCDSVRASSAKSLQAGQGPN